LRTFVDEVEKDLFRVKVPLRDIPLKYVNSYIIRDDESVFIVDPGMNRRECLDTIQDALSRLRIRSNKMDFFITHFHSDHIGLVGDLASLDSRIYLNDEEIETVRNAKGQGFGFAKAYMIRYGFPEAILEKALDQLLAGGARSYSWRPELDPIAVMDGDRINMGPYSFLCVHTPGHSPGHTCLYEPERKMLLAGDHILGDITPSVESLSDNANPLASYLDSLEKVKELDLDIIFPGHRRPVTTPNKRIAELIRHHHERCDEVLDILNRRPKNAYQVATKMTWDLPYASWEDVPESQKWFAMGETIAHLRYLESNGAIRREEARGGPIVFFLS